MGVRGPFSAHGWDKSKRVSVISSARFASIQGKYRYIHDPIHYSYLKYVVVIRSHKRSVLFIPRQTSIAMVSILQSRRWYKNVAPCAQAAGENRRKTAKRERPRKRRRWVEEKEPGRGSGPFEGKQEEAALRKAEAAPRGKALFWLIALM